MPAIPDLLTAIAGQRDAVLAHANRLDAEQLAFRPTPASWSTLDVVEHLVKVEEGTVARIKHRDPRTWREAVRARLALGTVSLYFAVGRRLKVPVQAIVPQGGATLTDLASRWESAQQAMRRTLEAFGPDQLRRPVMRHPVLGLLLPAETLTFLHRHIAHHRRQIARIRRAPGYPR